MTTWKGLPKGDVWCEPTEAWSQYGSPIQRRDGIGWNERTGIYYAIYGACVIKIGQVVQLCLWRPNWIRASVLNAKYPCAGPATEPKVYKTNWYKTFAYRYMYLYWFISIYKILYNILQWFVPAKLDEQTVKPLWLDENCTCTYIQLSKRWLASYVCFGTKKEFQFMVLCSVRWWPKKRSRISHARGLFSATFRSESWVQTILNKRSLCSVQGRVCSS